MKTILITGSTDGIGKLAAFKLAQQQYKILLHGRNTDKLFATQKEIIQQSENEHVTLFCADLSSFNSIKQMADNIAAEVDSIDVLINNAGVYHSSSKTNAQGLDMRFAVNYLAPYLLTQKLLPLLKASNQPRVINLSSAAQASVSIEALKGKTDISTQQAYAQSKLALTMWSFYFARQHTDIRTIAVNPGSLLNTKMVKEAFGQFWSSADKGADILTDLATKPAYNNSSGKYYDNDNGGFGTAQADAYNPEKIQQLLTATEEILEGIK